jgi:integrase/recombinase XerC
VPRPIRDDDLALAVDRADNTTRAMLCLAAYAGLRAKEIAGLCREDILETMDAPTLVVTAPKGRRQRTVPLHPALWDALRAAGLPRSGYLFRQRSGLAVPAWKVSQVVNDHLRSLGIDSTLHKLRHHFATKVYAASLDLRLTQELLGHSSPTTTAMYTAYNRTQAVDVVGRLTIGSHRRSA